MLRSIRATPLVSATKFIRAASSLPGAPSSWESVVPLAGPTEPIASSSSTSQILQELPEEFANLTSPPPIADSGPPVGTAYGPPKPAAQNPLTALKQHILHRPYSLYVTATRNNTIATFTRPGGQGLATFTGGKCGFKGQKRAGFEAGYQCAMQVFKVIEQEKVRTGTSNLQLELFLSGFGQGRDAMFKALMSGEGQVVRQLILRVTDCTPIMVGGTRAKKMRRS